MLHFLRKGFTGCINSGLIETYRDIYKHVVKQLHRSHNLKVLGSNLSPAPNVYAGWRKLVDRFVGLIATLSDAKRRVPRVPPVGIYMFEGDITYTDEALYANKLSVIYEDKAAARKTLDRVCEFISHNPTVYLGTHTPFGYENLEGKGIVDLNNPPKTLPVGEIVFKTKAGKYICSVCGYVYDPQENNGMAFEDLPQDWKCPRCKQLKTKFNAA